MSVISVSISPQHSFSKSPQHSITLLPGLGVQGDCHAGETVQHRSRMGIKPPPPNLRQVHLMQSELFREFQTADSDGRSYEVKPGELGENITTAGIDLLGLSKDTRLHFVPTDAEGNLDLEHPVVKVTGLRNPCPQIDKFQQGLRERCLVREMGGRAIVGRKAGIMAVVEVRGEVVPGSKIIVERPEGFAELECV